MILTLFAAAVMASCIEDKGNYEYIPMEEFMPIKIEGVEPSYSFVFGNTVTITPQISGITDGQDLEYTWSLFNVGLGASKRDTISRERDLNIRIDQSVGYYTLIYTVKDRNNSDLFVTAQSEVKIGTIFSEGWFVFEDNGADADADLVSLGDEVVVREDIVTESIGKRLDGKAVKIAMNPAFSYQYENPDGTMTSVSRKTAFYICTQKDMKVFSTENMKLFYNFEDCFFEAPEKRNIMNVDASSTAVYLNNDGKAYHYNQSSGNIGKFSAATIGVENANSFINKNWYSVGSETLIFDDISKSFYRVFGSDTFFETFKAPKDPQSDKGPVENMGKDLVDMMYWTYLYDRANYTSTYFNIAVMKDESKSYIYKIAYLTANYPLTAYQELPLDLPVADENSVRAMHTLQEVMFFTVNGNELHRFELWKDYKGNDEPILFPQGETIAYMKHFRSLPDGVIDLFGVLTNTDDGNWHLYTIQFIGGASEFDRASLKLVASGKGTGRYLMRMYNNNPI